MTKQPDWLDTYDASYDTFGDYGLFKPLAMRRTHRARRCNRSPWDHFAFTGRVSRQQSVCSLYFHSVYWD